MNRSKLNKIQKHCLFWLLVMSFWVLFFGPRTSDFSIFSATLFYQFYLLVPGLYLFILLILPRLENNKKWLVLVLIFFPFSLSILKVYTDDLIWEAIQLLFNISMTKLIYNGNDIFKKAGLIYENYLLVFLLGYIVQLKLLKTKNEKTENEKPNGSILYLKVNKQLKKVDINEVICIEGLKDYVKVIVPNETIVLKKTMTYMQEQLPKDRFIRVQKSYIVNIEKIISISGNLIQTSYKDIPVGANYRDRFFDIINNKVF